MLAGFLTIIPSVMKRIAPPRAWMKKKVAGWPWSLAGLQQANTLPWPGQTRILSGLKFILNNVTQKHSHISITVATVPSRTPARVHLQQTWTGPAARQQSLMVHQCEHCCWHRELLGNTHTHKENMINREQCWTDPCWWPRWDYDLVTHNQLRIIA